jgi:tetratricopeptide (TPR) repeat protein
MLKYAERLERERGGNHLQSLWGKFRIGSFYIHKGDWSEADRYLGEADNMWNRLPEPEQEDHGLKILRTMILNNRANLLIRRGLDYKTAEEYLKQSCEIGTAEADRRAQAYSYWSLANLYMNLENQDKALLYLDLSQPHFREMALQRYEWNAEVSKARIYCALGAREAARSLIDNAAPSEMQGPWQQAEFLATKAFVYAQNQDFEKAREAFEESISQLEIAKYEAVGARLDYAEMLVQLKEFKQAREQLDLARQIASDLGAQALLKRAEQILQQIPS